MGVVWLARDDELEREVALKFLPELVLHDRALLDNLKAETRRSLELTHRHIVRIYDFVQDQNAACISMEYIDGDTLSQLRARKPHLVFAPAELHRYVAELCEALEYAHTRARIVHRDIKPSNLMVNSRGEMKVADFGIARSLTDSVSMLTKTRHTSGTLLYMSPQQLDGERTSPLDDVYSVGAVLYELLTSKPPFYRGQIDHHQAAGLDRGTARRTGNRRATGAGRLGANRRGVPGEKPFGPAAKRAGDRASSHAGEH
jgi:serine/threonine protein kinase